MDADNDAPHQTSAGFGIFVSHIAEEAHLARGDQTPSGSGYRWRKNGRQRRGHLAGR